MELLSKALIYDIYEIYQKLDLIAQYKSDLLSVMSNSTFEEFVSLFERICLSDKIFVNESGKLIFC